MSLTISGHRASGHRHLDPARAAYRMRARTYQAAADARGRDHLVRARTAGSAVPAAVSAFSRALSAAGRRPGDNADPYPFRDGA